MKKQLTLAVIIISAGMILIFAAFLMPPTGIIDSSVLVAFGEILTFSGSLIGIDYKYRYQKSSKL